jgi:4-amino-4-deoxy-L-arabinose transferase-like glycosyltransferase
MLFGVLTAKAAVALFVIQSVFSALTCIPILAIGERTMSRRAGIIAATLWALFPWFSKWAVTWVWEISLSALLFALLFWYALRLARPAPATRMLWIGFGALWGFALLVNPALLPLFPAALLWCGIELRKRALASNWSSWIKLAFLSLAACFLVISPWLVRNRVVFGQWVFLRGNFGFEFYLGNNAHSLARGWGGQHPTGNPAELGRYRTIGEVAYVRERTHDALQWVRQSPAQFALLTAERARYFWDGSAMAYRPAVSWYWCPWSFAAFSFLMLPALLIAHRRRLYGWPLFFSALLLYPIPYYLTFSQVRYRHVLEPLMLLLLVSALHRQLDLIWNRLFRRTREISHPHSQLVAN